VRADTTKYAWCTVIYFHLHSFLHNVLTVFPSCLFCFRRSREVSRPRRMWLKFAQKCCDVTDSPNSCKLESGFCSIF
jgi:hypothetical protein